MRSAIVLLSLLVLFSCKQELEQPIVNYAGALRTMMSGDISKKIELDSLSKLSNLYALGAFEGLSGEVQISNGVSFNSRAKDSTVVIENEIKGAASLLVYAQVKEWIDIPNVAFQSTTELENLLSEQAKMNGLDIEKPFPFIMEGKVKALKWHVIKWDKNDSIHTHKKHKEAGLNGVIKDATVEIIGFYSNKHKAIFTHHSTNVHMHFIAEEENLAGHIDDIKINEPLMLKLPKKQEKRMNSIENQ